ncbi:MAG TPA: hypothetical protein VF432_24790 [Thermoanaerobaculia bacterium]
MQPAPPPQAPRPTPPPPPRGNAFRRFLIVAFLIGAAFLGGYIPQRLDAGRLRAELDRTDLQLRLAHAHRLLGVASQEAQRSNYASAAQAAARFFDEAATLARVDAFENEQRTRVALLAYTSQRDEVMSLLSAGDPTVRDRLAGLFLTMNGVIERREAPAE